MKVADGNVPPAGTVEMGDTTPSSEKNSESITAIENQADSEAVLDNKMALNSSDKTEESVDHQKELVPNNALEESGSIDKDNLETRGTIAETKEEDSNTETVASKVTDDSLQHPEKLESEPSPEATERNINTEQQEAPQEAALPTAKAQDDASETVATASDVESKVDTTTLSEKGAATEGRNNVETEQDVTVPREVTPTTAKAQDGTSEAVTAASDIEAKPDPASSPGKTATGDESETLNTTEDQNDLASNDKVESEETVATSTDSAMEGVNASTSDEANAATPVEANKEVPASQKNSPPVADTAMSDSEQAGAVSPVNNSADSVTEAGLPSAKANTTASLDNIPADPVESKDAAEVISGNQDESLRGREKEAGLSQGNAADKKTHSPQEVNSVVANEVDSGTEGAKKTTPLPELLPHRSPGKTNAQGSLTEKPAKAGAEKQADETAGVKAKSLPKNEDQGDVPNAEVTPVNKENATHQEAGVIASTEQAAKKPDEAPEAETETKVDTATAALSEPIEEGQRLIDDSASASSGASLVDQATSGDAKNTVDIFISDPEKALKKMQTERTLIEQYMAKAKENFAALRLTTPAENNAYYYYKLVLEIDPQHEGAKKGSEKIFDRYITMINKAIKDNKINAAKRYLDRAKTILPESSSHQEVIKYLSESLVTKSKG